MDLIITVCDNAAGEVCPIWPGHPATAHWGYPDPSAGDGTDAEKLEAFRKTMHAMKRRLELLISLPPDKLAQDRAANHRPRTGRMRCQMSAPFPNVQRAPAGAAVSQATKAP
jgi:hypothetical protein